MAIKGKTEEPLLRQLKTCERKMQELKWLHQKTKPENRGHWRRKRGASKRDL
jgi:hypothetical protein